MSPDEPNPFVFDFKSAEDAVSQHFDPQVKLLQEMCAYGSNLLIRSYGGHKRELEDLIIIGCFFRQFLIHLDAAAVLLSHACVEAAQLHQRAMLEEWLCLKWLLKEHTALRAKHFYVANLRRRQSHNRMADPSTEESRELKAAEAVAGLNSLSGLESPEFLSEAAKQNRTIAGILSRPEFSSIDRAFGALRAKRKFDPDWYKPCGASSIAAIAKNVGMELHYKMFYSKWSEAMHSSGFYDHHYTDEHGTSIEQIRNLAGIDGTFRMTATMAMAVFEVMVHRFRPGEETALAAKYLSEWRDRSVNIKKVKINRGSIAPGGSSDVATSSGLSR